MSLTMTSSRQLVNVTKLTTKHYIEEIDGEMISVDAVFHLTDGRVFIHWSDGEKIVHQPWVNFYAWDE